MIDCFQQQWHAHIIESEKYTWYSSFKDLLQPEKYLNLVTHRWYRAYLARLRIRVLGLSVNKRWYENDNLIYTICPLCKDGVENDMHFLFVCREYNSLRSKFSLFNKYTRNSKLEVLFNNEEAVQSIAKYIAEAYSHRKKVLSQ